MKIDFLSILDTDPPYQEQIDYEAVKTVKNSNLPHRICFSSVHQGALKRSKDKKWIGNFSIPFRKTIEPIFYRETEIELFHSKKFNNYWRSIRTEEEFQKINEFVEKYREIVFLRDTLALSIAISENIDNDDKRTTVGELEYLAKYKCNPKALNELVNVCESTIQKTPFYSEANYICAIPSSKPDTLSLPMKIANILANKADFDDLSNYLRWDSEKPSLKGLELDKKWPALDSIGISVDVDLTDKTVILIDDLYQSGITMQFVAMNLQKAGAEKIFGLALVKSRRDSDNL